MRRAGSAQWGAPRRHAAGDGEPGRCSCRALSVAASGGKGRGASARVLVVPSPESRAATCGDEAGVRKQCEYSGY